MINISNNIQRIDAAFIGRNPRVVSTGSSFLGLVSPFWDVISDISGAFRNSFSTLYSTSTTRVLPVLGFTTGLALLGGIGGLFDAVQQIRTAQKVNDFWGLVDGGLSLGARATMALGGLVYIPARIFQIITANGGSAQMVGATGSIGNVGNGFFMGTYLFFLLSAGLTLFKAAPFRYELEHQEGNEIDFLKGRLEISEEEREAIIDQVIRDVENFDPEKGIASATEVSMSDEEINALEDTLLATDGVDGLEKKEINLILMLACGEYDKLKTKKEVELGRLIGQKNVEILKKGKIRDTAAFIDAVRWENTKAMILSSAVILVCATGITAMILSFVLTGGTSAIVLAALFALVALGWLGIDMYWLVRQLESPELTTSQKVMLVATTILMNLASSAALFVSGGTSEILMVAGVCVLTTLLALYANERITNAKKDLPAVA